MNNPCVSVIVPVYNVEKYINRCVDSILAQNYRNLEIILIDDGSPDKSGMLCDAYLDVDNRIKVIHQENGGLSKARNVGISHANGEYILFVDSDDYITSDMVSVLMEKACEKNADMVVCGYCKVDENGKVLSEKGIKDWCGTGHDYFRQDGIINNYAWCRIYKNSLFNNIRFPEGKHFEDIFIMHNLCWESRIIATVPNKLYMYCMRDGSIVHSTDPFVRMEFIDGLWERIRFHIDKKIIDDNMYYWLYRYSDQWGRIFGHFKRQDKELRNKAKKYQKEYRRLFRKGIFSGYSFKRKILLSIMYLSPLAYYFLQKEKR